MAEPSFDGYPQGVGRFLLEERFGQRFPEQAPLEQAQAAPAAPPAEPTAMAAGIGSLPVAPDFSGYDFSDIQIGGVNLGQMQGTMDGDLVTEPEASEPASGSQVFNMDDPYLASTGGPPIGYQGGGGEYNPQDGYTDEDRVAADAWYAEQRRAQREQELADSDDGADEEEQAPVTPPPPEPPPYTEVPPPPVTPPPPPPFTPPPEPPPPPPVTPPPVPPVGPPQPPVVVPPPQPPVMPPPVSPPPLPPQPPVSPPPPQPPVAPPPLPPQSPVAPPPTSYTPLPPPVTPPGFDPSSTSTLPSGTLIENYGPPEQPVFQVAVPEYVPIFGPSDPVVDPFANPINPQFAPLPTGNSFAPTAPQQAMIDEILSGEQQANPFMNPYLRSGVFSGG